MLCHGVVGVVFITESLFGHFVCHDTRKEESYDQRDDSNAISKSHWYGMALFLQIEMSQSWARGRISSSEAQHQKSW